MKPKDELYFRIEDIGLEDVACCLLNNMGHGFLTNEDKTNLAATNKHWNEFVPICEELREVDFTPIKEMRLDYETQEKISEERVKQASACLLHYGGDPRWLIRYCGNEFTAQH